MGAFQFFKKTNNNAKIINNYLKNYYLLMYIL